MCQSLNYSRLEPRCEIGGRGGGQIAGIAVLVEATLDAAVARDLTREPESVDEAIGIDQNSRLLAHQLLPEIAAKSS